MTAKELLNKYLQFFESKGHTIVPSASLIPENDPSVLFTTAGMQPMVPYLLGEAHPGGTRVTDVQKCVRTGDLDEVGDNTHHTFFQMLGNWSFGDYFKNEAIKWSFEFLTSAEWLGISLDNLAFTVFEGDDLVPKDTESADKWKSLGVSEDRIAFLGKDNFWSAGATGPCGPSTEMFFWTGDGPAPTVFDAEDETWVEIWNDVLMGYNKPVVGELEELTQKNIDTGMGLERTAAVLVGEKSAYETDLFVPIIQKIESLSGKDYGVEQWGMRIIADHVRASVFIIGDPNGVVPSNKDQGYVLRRLIRRAVNVGRSLGMKDFMPTLAEIVIEIYTDPYTELTQNKEKILAELEKEETKFGRTIEQGMKKFEELANVLKSTASSTLGSSPEVSITTDKPNKSLIISGVDAFDLYQSYGFPIEITEELAKERGISVDMEGFKAEQEKHSNKSKQGAEQKFKGGMADHSEMSVKYHTTTHLLHAALQKVLGPHAKQRGSNITADRLRFDFEHGEKMTPEEKEEVTRLVNAAIQRDYKVSFEELPLEKAQEKKALGLFGDNYGEVVKVYSIGDADADPEADPIAATFSRELCGGPHVENTGSLGTFRIKKEESCSAGVRRIKAILE